MPDIPVDNILLLAAIEVAAVLLAVSVFLFIRNRALSNVIKKLRERMEKLVELVKASKEAPPPPDIPDPPTYIDHVNKQIDVTKEHHSELNSEQDIALDLSPESPIPQRAAALRHAILLAEKEALTFADDEMPDWSQIRAKYEQIFTFIEDYSDSDKPEPKSTPEEEEEASSLQQELDNAKKRIANLEKFKKLYFEMEEQWEQSKKDAKVHYDNLSGMADQVDDTEAFESALEGYQSSYGKFNNLFDGRDNTEIITQTVHSHSTNPATTDELNRLRNVAADQHRLINELQERLKSASFSEENQQLVNGLTAELEKQARFVQESETCIQLMEDELNSANKELDILKSRLKALPSLKAQLKDVISNKDEIELKMYALSSENRKLTKKLKEADSGPSIAAPVNSGEIKRIKQEYADLETRYAELEEKYLDLKMSQ